MNNALEQARRHLARCEVAAHVALMQWNRIEGTHSDDAAALAWRAYSDARDAVENARQVLGVEEARAGSLGAGADGGPGDGHDMPPMRASERPAAVMLTPLQLSRLLEVVGERCDRLHNSVESLRKVPAGDAESRRALDRCEALGASLEFWQQIETAIRDAR